MRQHLYVFALFIVAGFAGCSDPAGTEPLVLDSLASGHDDAGELKDMSPMLPEVLGTDGRQGDGLAVNDTDAVSTDWTGRGDLLPGTFGSPCTNNDDCVSGYCVESAVGKVCTTGCVTECPEGWECVQDLSASPDLVYICLPANLTLCMPCTTHAECYNSGVDTGARCVDFGPAGAFCGEACSDNDTCPSGYECMDVTLLYDQEGTQCVGADDAECECSEYGVYKNAMTLCSIGNDAGECGGVRLCEAAGLSDCDAPLPAPEECNGLDDDCDEVVDEDLGTVTCGEGICLHTTDYCVDGNTQYCDPLAGAVPELCNGQDDDCDGSTDEDFEDTNQDGLADCMTDDDDGDGVVDGKDNCPFTANPDQADFDLDTIGDACDPDDDDDKVADAEDCQPFNSDIHPGAPEECNDLDDNCDGQVDEGMGKTTCGVGECEHTVDNCQEGQDAACSPFEGAMPEECDGLDNDCDGNVDEGFDDSDADGLADCSDPDDDNDEIDDADDNCPMLFNPGQEDTDGDGFGDLCDFGCWLDEVKEWDLDCDGVPDSVDNCLDTSNPDQNDTDNNGAGDACDEDDDGDGVPDPVDNCPLVQNPDQLDDDDDGLGNPCDGDADGDGIEDVDDNCPGVANPDQADFDADELGDACDPDDDNDGEDDFTDCKPMDPAISHLAVEACNDIDDDCDEMVDEQGAKGCETWYMDLDQDGYGVDGQGKCLCGPEELYTTQEIGDCKPLDDDVHPGVKDVCDGIDNDCDGKTDAEFDDLDQDGQADCVDNDDDGDLVDDVVDNCPATPNEDQADFDDDGDGNVCDDDDDNDNFVDDDDCQPFDALAFPGAPEVCNGQDDNCEGAVDEALGSSSCGLGPCEHTQENCVDGLAVQCDPFAGSADEICDDVDNDCDGNVDNDALDASTWYGDGDGDQYGNPLVQQVACDQPANFVEDGTDCDDSDKERNPGLVESCDGKDNNCDQIVDEGSPDFDTDGQADCVDPDDDNDGFNDGIDCEPLNPAVPSCQGKECGDDGCGGSCGGCQGNFQCQGGSCVCVPDCAGKNCGDDGCGGSCGGCADNEVCSGGTCICIPNCNGKQCGGDGCGGNCGTCSGNYSCQNGQCVCQPNCGGKNCGSDGCGGSCGSCSGNYICQNGTCKCQPNCSGKQCGSNGCGGSCGSCSWGYQCNGNQCKCGPSPHFKVVNGNCLPSCGGLLGHMGLPDAGQGCCPSGCKFQTAGGPGTTWDCTYCCASYPGQSGCN